MKRSIFFIIILICLSLCSCGSTRFVLDRTERNIVELGGEYDKTTEENIKKFYDSEGLDELLRAVYEGTYTVIDVQGYLGDDIYKEYQKREKELLKEIETLRSEEGLEAVANAVLDETYPENMVIAAFGGEETKLSSDFRAVYEEKAGIKNQLFLILQEQGYEGIKDALVNGEYDEETIEEYLGKNTLEKAQEIYAKETGTDGFNPTKKATVDSSSSSSTTMQFVSTTGDETYEKDEKKEASLITEIVAVVVVDILFYVIAAVVRSLNRAPLSTLVAVCVTFFSTGLAFGVSLAVFSGWSIYFLGYILILPVYFILTADVRD